MNIPVQERILTVLKESGEWLSARQIANRLPGIYITSRTVGEYLRFEESIERCKDITTRRLVYRYAGAV